MATTVMTSANSSTIKKWEKKTWVEGLQTTAFGELVQTGAIYDASSRFRGFDSRGDALTFNYVGKLINNPLGEGSVAFGNEEALDTGTHQMALGLTRIAVSNPNNSSIEQQRTDIQFDEVTAKNQANRALELLDTSVFQQLAGVNPTSFTINGTTYATTAQKLQVQGHNAPTAPTTNRIIRAGNVAADQSLTSNDTMSMDLVDFALEKILSADQPIEPCSDGYFKLFLHPYQVVDLRQDSGGKIQWYNNELAKVQGGKESNLNYKSQGSKPVKVGSYLNVDIYQAPRVAQGANGSTSAVVTAARRAVLVGKDALSFASPVGGISASDTQVPFKMFVQLSDYDYIKGMDFRSIYGIKKMSPSNAEDIGAFVISTYANAHA
jgi:hypothetical protein